MKLVFSGVAERGSNFRGTWYPCDNTMVVNSWAGTSINYPSTNSQQPPKTSGTYCGELGSPRNGEKMCCKALTACCVSCTQNLTVEEVCRSQPNLGGC